MNETYDILLIYVFTGAGQHSSSFLINEVDIILNNKTWFAARLVEMLPRSLAEGLNYQIEKYSRLF